MTTRLASQFSGQVSWPMFGMVEGVLSHVSVVWFEWSLSLI